jgi:hypothetical protein
MRRLTALVVFFTIACESEGTSPPFVRCGTGTVERDGACVLEMGACAPGTSEELGRCVVDDIALTCGTGTHEEGGVCVPDLPPVPKLAPTSWSRNVRVGPRDLVAFNPSLAVDTAGRIFLAITRPAGFGATVEVWRSNDGASFTRIAEQGNGDAFPGVIAVDASDRIFVAWPEVRSGARIAYSVSLDGESFGPAETLVRLDDYPFGLTLSMGATSSGGVAATWSGLFPSLVSWASTSSTTPRFGLSTLIYRPLDEYELVEVQPGVTFDREGRALTLALLYGANVSMRVWSGAPEPLSAVLTATIAMSRHFSFAATGAIASGAGGSRIVFTDARSRRVGVYESRSEDGVSWTTPSLIHEDPTPRTALAPALASDESGRHHVIWFDTWTGGWLLYSASAQPGAAFGPAERVNEVEAFESEGNSFTPEPPAIAARNGRRYAAWSDVRGGVYFSVSPAP